ncbi:hypothetical protein RIR_jg6909.t1 [Rhizophagus irregularis DAOM 181602=DAOM 197198]|nr:hypothetical protein RIR_jg6909.t1 [Rhizophagus irregularis DAOM 181602=DAOM 197198]
MQSITFYKATESGIEKEMDGYDTFDEIFTSTEEPKAEHFHITYYFIERYEEWDTCNDAMPVRHKNLY